jgi:hypothetical protein
MDANDCPRCGLPEGWTLKLKVRLVLLDLAVTAIVCLALGYGVGRLTGA